MHNKQIGREVSYMRMDEDAAIHRQPIPTSNPITCTANSG